LGAFEEHVFDAVGEAGTGPIFLVDGTGANPELNGDEGVVGVFAEENFEAVGEGVDLGVEAGDVEGRFGEGWDQGRHGRKGDGALGTTRLGREGMGDGERRLGSGAGAGMLVFGGKEGFGEGGIEVVAAVEVFEGVALISAEVTDFDEIVDDVTDVETAVETPLIEEGERHGAELFDDVVTETCEQFLAGDVLVFLTLAEHFGGVVEGDADEVVGFWTVAVVTLDGVVDGLGEQRGHREVRSARLERRGRGMWRKVGEGQWRRRTRVSEAASVLG
jgi:hypothetical protein